MSASTWVRWRVGRALISLSFQTFFAGISLAEPTVLPDRFGGAAFGSVLGHCSGQLFALSGFDGPTNSSSFTGVFTGHNFDLMLCGAPSASRYLNFSLTATINDVSVATNDVLLVQAETGQASVTYSQWHTIVGALPHGSNVSLARATSVLVNGTLQCWTLVSTDATALCTSFAERGAFALSYGATEREALARGLAGLQTNVDEAVADRLAMFLDQPVVDHKYQKLLSKVLSVMRVNTLNAEGDIRELWSTPDREPHRNMWLWDSCFHSIGMNHINSTASWWFLKALLDIQTPEGFIPISRNPSGASKDHDETQPPLLAFALWHNFQAHSKLDPAEALERHVSPPATACSPATSV
ncbi:hypothetical protein CYMTET_17412 [Cymbomonas tetramitiformis]|uniref:Mannosylglycerate hydrolase MGH1-like glycoside hydrolase domain-containing protein n=1 Tax=Cymbomonas tetramitiformis TaxID=36881 RepID=A0AAE0GBL0_9CHLO|nr:hypothetical protein CYMTET_17412 [Cymbomonas tetramitiformis]